MSKKVLIIVGVIVLVLAIMLIAYLGLGQNDNVSKTTSNNGSGTSVLDNYDQGYEQEDIYGDGEIPNVKIQFGYSGKTFIAEMENNETAIELVRNITTSGRNLPIYNYDNFEGYEYFQYYDIPSSYKIPSNPTNITSAKAGELYYSSPNRIILFYQDAEINGNYTKIGEIKDTSGLKDAVEDNPVLEGWGNKIISITYAD